MSTRSRSVGFALALLLLALAAQSRLLSPAAADPDGIKNPLTSNGLGFDGVNNVGASSGPPPACSHSLDYSDGCNLVYMTLLGGG